MSDDERLRQILAEEGLSTTTDEPGVGAWLADIWRRFQAELFETGQRFGGITGQKPAEVVGLHDAFGYVLNRRKCEILNPLAIRFPVVVSQAVFQDFTGGVVNRSIGFPLTVCT